MSPPDAASRPGARPGGAGGAGGPGGAAAARRPGLRCDFCGEEADSVRRVALDQGYDRLQTPHRELYACHPCSERKERLRRGLAR